MSKKRKKTKVTLGSIKEVASKNNLDFKFLEDLIKKSSVESIKDTFSELLVEDEKKNQKKISKKIDDLNLRSETEEETVQDEQQDNSPEDQDSPKEKTDTSSPKVKLQKLPSAMEPEDIARVLNIIRAGKSLKDGEVRERFDIWWDLLSGSEKIALKAFLDGIAQIITGDVTADQASKPSMKPYNVEMSSAPKQSVRKSEKSDSSEEVDDDPDQSPIVVGEVNSALQIKSRMVD